MLRRHFFLIGAGVLVALMVLAGVWRLTAGGEEEGGGGGGGAQAAAPGGGRGGPGGGGGGRGGGAGGRTPVVATVPVAVRPFTDRVEALGVAKARQSITVTSDTTELITAVRFTSGQRVSRGQVLVELRANEQDAELLRGQAAVRQAEREYRRWRTLADRGVAPRATAEQYLAALEDARAVVAASGARRADRVIRAPFSGTVGLSDIAPGALVSPGTPIATLDDYGLIYVDFALPERYLATLSTGASLQATADAIPNRVFSGRIERLDTRINAQTRAITARAAIPNPGGLIRPGMTVRVSVVQGERQSPAVPESAVQLEADQAFVYRVTRGQQGPRAQRADVVVGLRQDGFAEVRSGLQVGETVVAEGANRVQPNQPVRLASEQRGAGGRPGGRPGAPPSGAAPQRGAAP